MPPRDLPELISPHLRALAARSPAVARQFAPDPREAVATADDRDDPIVEIAAPTDFAATDFLDTGRKPAEG